MAPKKMQTQTAPFSPGSKHHTCNLWIVPAVCMPLTIPLPSLCEALRYTIPVRMWIFLRSVGLHRAWHKQIFEQFLGTQPREHEYVNFQGHHFELAPKFWNRPTWLSRFDDGLADDPVDLLSVCYMRLIELFQWREEGPNEGERVLFPKHNFQVCNPYCQTVNQVVVLEILIQKSG